MSAPAEFSVTVLKDYLDSTDQAKETINYTKQSEDAWSKKEPSLQYSTTINATEAKAAYDKALASGAATVTKW